MSFRGEFTEILQKKLGNVEPSPTPAAPIKSQYMNFSSPFLGWADHKIHKFSSSMKLKYPSQRATSKPVKKSKPPVKKATPQPGISILKLSKKSQKAFFLMEKLGAQFEDGKISNLQLKSEFRRLAKIYHPDGQHSQSDSKRFHYLNTCYRLISKDLKNCIESQS